MRLQLSTLFEPIATRANFWATKFISLVVFEQLNSPNACGPFVATDLRKPVAALRSEVRDSTSS